MSENIDNDILNKVRALLRKAEDKGATPEESDSFMRGAAKLMAKHNIDRVVVENAEADAAQKEKLNLVKENFSTGRSKCYTDESIMRILRNCFGVRVFWRTGYNFDEMDAFRASEKAYEAALEAWMNGEGLAPDEPKRPKFKRVFTYVLVGNKPDVDLAGALIPEFGRIMRHKYAEWMREEGANWNAADATAFYDGFASEYINANRVATEEAMIEAGQAARDQYALAVVDKDKAVEEFAKATVQTVRARAGTGSGARSGYNYDAHDAGQKSAKNLNLKDRRLT